MGGGYYSSQYQLFTSQEAVVCINKTENGTRIIIKPSVDSDSGRGVEMYERESTSVQFHLKNHPEIILDEKRLDSMGKDYIVQKAVDQHPYLAQFNPTSINTLRIATYRSVKDDKVHILSSVIRIGKDGSIVDNAHAGGRMVRIYEDGTLANFTSNQYGDIKPVHNGIDYSKTTFKIPAWDKIKDFAKEVSSNIRHARLVQLDVTVDSSGTPKLIEFNIGGYSMWIAQFTGTPAFGDFTDEIRQYAIDNLNI